VVDRKPESHKRHSRAFSKGAGEPKGRSGKGKKGSMEATAEPSTPDRAFDRWLERGLKDLYAPVLDEPVPDDLVELIRKHRKRVS
jgi:hypothetical protein